MTSALRRSIPLGRVVLGALTMCPLLSSLVGAETSERSIVVSLHDLDANDPDDARVIYERIKLAAEHVCRRSSDRDMALTPERWACVRAAIARAVASIRSPALTRLAGEPRR
jgi:UrcA family protein